MYLVKILQVGVEGGFGLRVGWWQRFLATPGAKGEDKAKK